MKTSTKTRQRTYTEKGAVIIQPIIGRIDSHLDKMEFHDIRGSQTGHMQGSLMKTAIKELNLPKPTKVAEDTELGFMLCAIECNYTNGRAIIYIVDHGSEATAICSDLYPTDPDASPFTTWPKGSAITYLPTEVDEKHYDKYFEVLPPLTWARNETYGFLANKDDNQVAVDLMKKMGITSAYIQLEGYDYGSIMAKTKVEGKETFYSIGNTKCRHQKEYC